MADKNLFRPQAMERYASPDNIERLMPVAGAQEWVPIVATAALVAVLVAWCFLGTVPTIVTARGVLVRPRKVVSVQSAVPGRVQSLLVHAGDHVTAGTLLAVVNQEEIRKKVEEDRRSVQALEAQDRTKAIAEKTQLLLQEQQDALERKSLEAQRTSLKRIIAGAGEAQPALQRRAESVRQQVAKGLLGYASKDVTDAETALRDNEEKIHDSTAKLEQLDGQLKQLETRRAALEKSILELSSARRNEIAVIEKSAKLSEFQIHQESRIVAEYSGRITEVFTATGQVLPAGGRVVTLEMDDSDTNLTSISYFPVRDGKKIMPGMRLQITPDTVQRERFGGIIGTVVSVSALPVTRDGVLSTVGNAETAQALTQEGAYVEIRARLDSDPTTYSGFRWSSSKGPGMKLSSGLTHSTRVKVEGRAPVTYVLPILRDAAGVY